MAFYYGTTSAADSWVIASTLPNMLFSTLFSSLSDLMVPMYVKAKTTSDSEGKRLVSEFFSLTTVFGLGILTVIYPLVPYITHLFAPAFKGEELRTTILLTDITLPTLLFWIWIGVFGSTLQASNYYGLTAFAPAVQNVIRIGLLVVLAKIFGIYAAAIGFVVGVGAQAIFLWVSTVRSIGTVKFLWPLSLQLAKQISAIWLPAIFSSLTYAIQILIERSLASSLSTGNLAALNYSGTLMQLPLALVMGTILPILFTRLSHLVVTSQFSAGKRLLFLSSVAVAAVCLLVVVVFTIYPNLIVQTMYKHGKFGSNSAILTAKILPYTFLGLPAVALSGIYNKFYFAVHKVKVMTYINLLIIVLNIAGDLILIRPMGASGLALATSIASTVGILPMITYAFIYLYKRCGE